MVGLGDEIKTTEDLYLGKWIPAGTTGRVVGRKHGIGGHLYFVQIGGEILTLASTEIEPTEEVSRCSRCHYQG